MKAPITPNDILETLTQLRNIREQVIIDSADELAIARACMILARVIQDLSTPTEEKAP